ncbi:hypothetical protein RHMOL_Rhmol05G0223800 [Rhododendron molle]|uniref:Uncharacterized protein n=1 Tax=Rhododendron molle TaxID=49168 RepID=A0ACC0NRQ6_RHOML|nr:hypothetical protein RHMOL_Rhmol05G0223800 [Rhododendron molle]
MAWDLAFAKFGRKMGLWVWHPFCQFCSIYGIGVEFYHFNSRCSCSKEMVDLVHLGMPEGPTHLNSRPPCVNVLIYFYALVFSGEQGMVDEAQKALEEAEALRKTDQKPRSCDICGAFLSVYDSDRCLADHFGGKLHLGYMQIREKLAELLDEREKKKKACEDERSLSTSFPSTDQKSEVESGTGEQARIVIRERAVNGEGITIVGAEIVIGIMIVINGMREGEMGHTPMIQGATGGHAHGQGNDPGTMFATVMRNWVLNEKP